jgi:hypothetical protein
MAQKRGPDEEKSDFEILAFLVLYYMYINKACVKILWQYLRYFSRYGHFIYLTHYKPCCCFQLIFHSFSWSSTVLACLFIICSWIFFTCDLDLWNNLHICYTNEIFLWWFTKPYIFRIMFMVFNATFRTILKPINFYTNLNLCPDICINFDL